MYLFDMLDLIRLFLQGLAGSPWHEYEDVKSKGFWGFQELTCCKF